MTLVALRETSGVIRETDGESGRDRARRAGAVSDRVKGLDAGDDGYLPKPFDVDSPSAGSFA